MSLLPSSIRKPRHFTPGLSPAAARRKYSKSSRTERLQTSYYARKRNHTIRVGWDRDEGEDGRRLASDPTVTLPGERRRQTPRLERQEAFRAPKLWDVLDTDVVVNDAELYRLGILYDDDDQIHESGFCLDAIMHEEPIYSINRAKRAKISHGRRFPLKEEDLHLSIELLSTYLGDDAAIAQFFAPVGNEEIARFRHEGFGGLNQQQNSSTLRNAVAESLSIIYELAESSTHSLAPTPTESDFPDLISDTEEEGYEECKEDIASSGNWALVLDRNDDADQFSGDTARLDTGVEVIIDGQEETVGTVGGAWVLLAGDDS
ncbi:hypothetical protein F4803DRAFT_542583 [Xylaria telfairii]|nr:hypothetical protein F4803DRAFT_542583 [Xylaria telfairii]